MGHWFGNRELEVFFCSLWKMNTLLLHQGCLPMQCFKEIHSWNPSLKSIAFNLSHQNMIYCVKSNFSKWFVPFKIKSCCFWVEHHLSGSSRKPIESSRGQCHPPYEQLGPGARFSKVPKTFRARKAIRKTATCLFCKAGLIICCKGIKITEKFGASRRLRFEDTNRIMSPEIHPKSFGTFEKQAQGPSCSRGG